MSWRRWSRWCRWFCLQYLGRSPWYLSSSWDYCHWRQWIVRFTAVSRLTAVNKTNITSTWSSFCVQFNILNFFFLKSKCLGKCLIRIIRNLVFALTSKNIFWKQEPKYIFYLKMNFSDNIFERFGQRF